MIPPEAPQVEVDVMVAGTIVAPHGYVFRRNGASPVHRLLGVVRSSGAPVVMPLLAYVVRHPTVGTLLIDTGLHPDAHGNLRRDYGKVLGTAFGKLRPAPEPFDAQLRGHGVQPADVELVVMTHLHVDHTSGMRLLPDARFVCARAEWDAASKRAVRGGYAAHHLPDASRMQLLELEAAESHGPFEHAHDLLGDGSVWLLSTPGHTPGHLSVLLNRARGGPLLVVGDAAYTLRNIDEQILPALTDDDAASRDSLARLHAYAQDRPDATLVPTHDPEAWRAV